MTIFQSDRRNGLPEIYLDKKESVFNISGSSFPEDSIDFYKPVFQWLKDFEVNPNSKLDVNITLDYFNTSSSKIFQHFIDIFNKLGKSGVVVTLDWNYYDDDENIYEAGVGYAENANFNFRMIEKNI
ncbi:MAG: DUF1987 domain-containing protein [Salinivirgaceae bacterium]|nr:DUF1987 domain-containing protein [Salinivirgaceae bacterium]MDD4745650.1 DUF1987 domain-containing protein [Salinivirgaceae bacterium]MDY0279298.1 DUF1987 domain-containing protein [Salinivirgaceae bacterium]